MIVVVGGELYRGEPGETFWNNPGAYVGQEIFDLSTGKDYIVTKVESDWTAWLEEVKG